MSTMRAVLWTVPFGRSRTAVAATASCPSRKTVASIGTASPTTAFAGQRPASMTGPTAMTGIRPIGVGRTALGFTVTLRT